MLCSGDGCGSLLNGALALGGVLRKWRGEEAAPNITLLANHTAKRKAAAPAAVPTLACVLTRWLPPSISTTMALVTMPASTSSVAPVIMVVCNLYQLCVRVVAISTPNGMNTSSATAMVAA